MKLYPIETGNFKLDGGAMFGVVPKSLWQRTNPADSNNMCPWSMRCLLIEDGDRLILVDTGMGDKQSEKFFSYYYLFGENTLQKSIEALGFSLDFVARFTTIIVYLVASIYLSASTTFIVCISGFFIFMITCTSDHCRIIGTKNWIRKPRFIT